MKIKNKGKVNQQVQRNKQVVIIKMGNPSRRRKGNPSRKQRKQEPIVIPPIIYGQRSFLEFGDNNRGNIPVQNVLPTFNPTASNGGGIPTASNVGGGRNPEVNIPISREEIPVSTAPVSDKKSRGRKKGSKNVDTILRENEIGNLLQAERARLEAIFKEQDKSARKNRTKMDGSIILSTSSNSTPQMKKAKKAKNNQEGGDGDDEVESVEMKSPRKSIKREHPKTTPNSPEQQIQRNIVFTPTLNEVNTQGKAVRRGKRARKDNIPFTPSLPDGNDDDL